MTLAQKRVEFTGKVTFLSAQLTNEGINHAYDYCKRSIETQTNLVNLGASKTMKSKHLDALAMDFVLYDSDMEYITDGDHPNYKRLGEIAKSLDLVWGGEWTFNDAGHVEWRDY